MASISVRDRAKLFGDLAATKSKNDDVPRTKELRNNLVSTSPFLTGNSPRSTATGGTVTYPYMSPRSHAYGSSIPSASPKSAVSLPYQRKDRPVSYGGSSTSYGGSSYLQTQRTASPAYACGTSSRTISPASRNTIEWPHEDIIPAPRALVEITKSPSFSDRKADGSPEYVSKAVVLPTSVSPLYFSKQNPSGGHTKQLNDHSPLKSLQNTKDHEKRSLANKMPSPKQTETNMSLVSTTKDRYIIHFETMPRAIKETVEVSNLLEKRIVVESSSEELSTNRSFVSDSENKAPEPESSRKPKSSRVIRLLRAKRAQSPAPQPAAKAMLKNSLAAAKTVMHEERSNIGSSHSSSRSSLSNKELSEIASRALKMASVVHPYFKGEDERPGSVRDIKTISKVSDHDSPLVILNAAKKKYKDDEREAATRLVETEVKATHTSNSSKEKSDGSKNIGIAASVSSESFKGRRLEHPAFAGRASPMPKAKVSSADIMSSFRQFNNLRNTASKSSEGRHKVEKNMLTTKGRTLNESKPSSSSGFYLPAVQALSESLGPDRCSLHKKKQEPAGKTRNDRLSTESGDNSMASQSSFLEQEETMHSMKQDDTMHDSVQQDESMHSMTEREYLDGFYRLGRLHVTSKSRVNDAYLSSLSSNTFSNQSIMTQSITSSMKSPAGKINQNEKVAFLLEPTPEYSDQTMKSDMLMGLSPGPSNRSARSFANSIVSASPNSAAPNDFDDYLDNKLEPFDSKSHASDKDSTELLDGAIDAAVDDMMNVEARHDSKPENDLYLNNLRIIEPPKETIEPSLVVFPKKRIVGSKSASILPTTSGRSNSPPGFIFNDSEESDVIMPPDPAGQNGFALSVHIFGTSSDEDENISSEMNGGSDKSDSEEIDAIMPPDPGRQGGFAPCDNIVGTTANEDDRNSSEMNGGSDNMNQYLGAELRQEILKVVSSVQFPVDFKTHFPESEFPHEKYHSSSSKKTISSSIRTGFSSIQNDEPTEKAAPCEGFEGSCSIRTGLSGLRDSQERSNSFRAENSAFIVLPVPVAREKAKSNTGSLPETIQEETPAKNTPISQTSTTGRDEDTSFNEPQRENESESLSIINKAKSTSTTEGSYQTGSGASASSGPDTTCCENESCQREQESDLPFKNLLPPIHTDEEDFSTSEKIVVMLSPSSRKSGAAPWKGGGFGKRVGDAIKNVLAKASPRAGQVTTPSASGHGMASKRQESRSLFSSVDDDEDIFGGLEDDNTVEDAKIVPTTPKDTAKTPKQRNSKATNRKNSKDQQHSILNKVPGPNKTQKRSLRARPNRSKKPQNKSGDDPASMYSDRSGTVVDEAEVLHVNSDITSSLIGGQASIPPHPPKNSGSGKIKIDESAEKKQEKQDKRSPNSKSKSSRKSKSSKTSSKADTNSSKSDKKISGRKSLKSKPDILKKEVIATDEVLPLEEDDEEEKPVGSMFMRLSCGGLGDLSSGFAGLCSQGHKTDNLNDLDVDDENIKDYTSVSSHSRLTDLEKKVWSEWDRLNGNVVGSEGEIGVLDTIAQNPLDKQDVPEKKEKKKEDHDKKREAARDKLLDIASTALSSHLSGKTGSSTIIGGADEGTLDKTDNRVSVSESSESCITKDTGSGASGTASGTESGDSAGSSSQDSTHCSSTEYSSGFESDFISEGVSKSPTSRCPSPTTPSAGPILLSISQRSLMEKFSKQLTAVGVEVLKLNRRKQWQTRYFTVSKEQIALSAHEAISKTGELAHCPKALLWLKKFNPKNGGYGITNIDKDGHGGMLLVDLVEIQVSNGKGDTLENPLPKKLLDKFKDSVLVTLQYKMNGTLRSIEFRCKDNDEAQFLCTCMRVIRDLLRRERSLRQKSIKLEKKRITGGSNTTKRDDIPIATKCERQ